MKLPRRNFLHLAAVAPALPVVSRIAWAQSYPSRPITMIVPPGRADGRDWTGPGRGNAETKLGQPVIVENVGGVNGSIGTGRVARAAPETLTSRVSNRKLQK
jgi:tripartite-type tricarboxylate transporter receptor subunit TctC